MFVTSPRAIKYWAKAELLSSSLFQGSGRHSHCDGISNIKASGACDLGYRASQISLPALSLPFLSSLGLLSLSVPWPQLGAPCFPLPSLLTRLVHHLDSISTYIHVCPRTLPPARTLYPLFSPMFLNVYERRQVDISLPSKTNISKPDFIISLPKAAYVGCLSMSSRNAGVPSSLVHLPPGSSSDPLSP